MEQSSKISANTLFHFTDSISRLVDILEETFHPRYCIEDIATLNRDYKEGSIPHHAIPMTCFCDIPLSEISDHTKRYGNYAIGLTKEWGIKNGISPVFYTIPDTIPSKSIRGMADYFRDVSKDLSKKDICVMVAYLAGFTKKYEGKQFKDGKYEDELVKFYNEREWRYIPPYETVDNEKNGPKIIMPQKILLNFEVRKKWDEMLREKSSISFEPNDIKYIIVKEEKEIIPIFDKIMTIKSRFSDEEKKLLTTRIISMENIKDDF